MLRRARQRTGCRLLRWCFLGDSGGGADTLVRSVPTPIGALVSLGVAPGRHLANQHCTLAPGGSKYEASKGVRAKRVPMSRDAADKSVCKPLSHFHLPLLVTQDLHGLDVKEPGARGRTPLRVRPPGARPRSPRTSRSPRVSRRRVAPQQRAQPQRRMAVREPARARPAGANRTRPCEESRRGARPTQGECRFHASCG